MANGNGDNANGNGGTAAIIATVLIVVLVVAVAVVVIVLVVAAGSNNNGVNVTINECTSGAVPRATKPNLPQAANQATSNLSGNLTSPVGPIQSIVHSPNVTPSINMPQYQPINYQDQIGDSGGTILRASNDNNNNNKTSAPLGIMHQPEAAPYRWDPNKAFPNPNPGPRPANSMGSLFGPSATEMQMYLPSREELLLAKSQTGLPKHIRRGPAVKRDCNFVRPTIVPESHKDWDTVKRGNRPHINEEHFREAIEHDRRIFGNAAGVVAVHG